MPPGGVETWDEEKDVVENNFVVQVGLHGKSRIMGSGGTLSMEGRGFTGTQ